ncbi:MAG: hypothetical protein QW154_01810 [Sulfolobales archaeon]
MGKLLKANAVALLVLALLVITYYSPHTPRSASTSTQMTTTLTTLPVPTTHMTIPTTAPLTSKTTLMVPLVSTAIPISTTTSTTTSRQGEDVKTTLNRLINTVLNKINEERQRFGVPPVELFNDTTARFRAEDMHSNKYFGHCDLDGMTPNYHYTKLGGSYLIEENVGYSYTVGGHLSPIDSAVKNVNNMIYDDAESNWGHRNSILDPTNNFVSIYATWDDSKLFLVIHMMKIWVEWIMPPTIKGEIFVAEGRIILNSSKLDSVLIYYSSPNKFSTFNSRLNILETCSSYSIGELIAGVVPEPYYYAGIKTIRPLKWVVSNQYFRVEFPVSFTKGGEGLYTVVFWIENTLQTKHPFDKERYGDYLPILEYTFLIKSN